MAGEITMSEFDDAVEYISKAVNEVQGLEDLPNTTLGGRDLGSVKHGESRESLIKILTYLDAPGDYWFMQLTHIFFNMFPWTFTEEMPEDRSAFSTVEKWRLERPAQGGDLVASKLEVIKEPGDEDGNGRVTGQINSDVEEYRYDKNNRPTDQVKYDV